MEKQPILEKLLNRVQSLSFNKRKYILGRVLTIIDGVFSDKAQRKAVKDLITNAFYSDNSDNLEWLFKKYSEVAKTEFRTKQEKFKKSVKEGIEGEAVVSNPFEE